MKWLLKLVLPSESKLAQSAASAVQAAVNKSEKEAIIAKYASIGNKASEFAAWATKLVADGKIDDIEKDEIAAKLLPIVQKLYEVAL